MIWSPATRSTRRPVMTSPTGGRRGSYSSSCISAATDTQTTLLTTAEPATVCPAAVGARAIIRRSPGPSFGDRGCLAGRGGVTMSEPLTKDEFDWIFSRVPRLTVEVLITSEDRGVLLALRDVDPCRGTWNLPGGTVRFGERLVDAVRRVAAAELGISVRVGALLGYIEYPSHYENGLDSPVGLVFGGEPLDRAPHGQWFTAVPENMHEEQRSTFSWSTPRCRRTAGSSV
jgi:8-oxo-dGTP diphosphatase